VTLASVIAHLPGRLAEGVALLEKLVAGTQPPRSAYNQRAWYGLFLPTLDVRAVIAAAETAVRLDQYRSYSSLDTLAVAYAEAGRLADARDTWLRQLKAAERFRPQGIDWYVYGRIAEQIGLLDIARDAYRRVTEPRDDLGLTVMDLVRRRLKVLGPAR
jgi:tetratricopeptide (TPR) repeat protein